MKKVLLFSLVIWLAGLGGAKAQCREYIEAIAESELEPYVLDGNFESPILSEGESVEFYRTFMSGLNYKIDVCGMEMFFKEITISEVEKKDNGKRTVKNVLFKNFGKNTEDQIITTSTGESLPLNGLTFYEFTPDHTMELLIKVKIVPFEGGGGLKLEGCLGILVGFSN
ncbi:MAG: hypothetical protein IJ894_00230 [Bacteroidales bacterium]|jgi:hypothetical protein|nr:hypothetical protein [Bacteroidales bacterium]MBR2199167.1 hypothetical protein [Bacteroidales bacterium]MBR3711892.1 hypothetical protein [Bacteroidales bacterium]